MCAARVFVLEISIPWLVLVAMSTDIQYLPVHLSTSQRTRHAPMSCGVYLRTAPEKRSSLHDTLCGKIEQQVSMTETSYLQSVELKMCAWGSLLSTK